MTLVDLLFSSTSTDIPSFFDFFGEIGRIIDKLRHCVRFNAIERRTHCQFLGFGSRRAFCFQKDRRKTARSCQSLTSDPLANRAKLEVQPCITNSLITYWSRFVKRTDCPDRNAVVGGWNVRAAGAEQNVNRRQAAKTQHGREKPGNEVTVTGLRIPTIPFVTYPFARATASCFTRTA